MSDTIKCLCSHCGAKYRLPVEAQGRTARCKRCGEKFHVPAQDNLEDTILTWLSGAGDEEEEAVFPTTGDQHAEKPGHGRFDQEASPWSDKDEIGGSRSG